MGTHLEPRLEIISVVSLERRVDKVEERVIGQLVD